MEVRLAGRSEEWAHPVSPAASNHTRDAAREAAWKTPHRLKSPMPGFSYSRDVSPSTRLHAAPGKRSNRLASKKALSSCFGAMPEEQTRTWNGCTGAPSTRVVG